MNGMQAESTDIPLESAGRPPQDRLEEDTNGIGLQQAPPHSHLAVFSSAILALPDSDSLCASPC